ncbi:MAG: NAD(+)/NADH kinase [Sulfuricurvum sp.]|uniref:NAD(+)/NADH kinase n=1 Tax=Sulfuricurvum sp. TaxID=2025608 RepID=UPI0026047437|nr:NAD(+)/NADH kinase [Sulfuricurvum sp.]MDD2368634.1 NAD(+)/NADH kinase [Sulfuricurvum sp.]MDD2950342.1 NAD(+)/NADH kinase [Sulfuricurvum sp.]MDD5117625.1 NAD(+)/NADH kinase [Sulfuricurvum sp.]
MKLTNIKRVGMLLRPSTPELKEMFFEAKRIFESRGIEVIIDNISGGMIDVMGQPFDMMCQNSDFLVTIGGDGTLISAVRRSYSYQLPVLGIHAGKLGFLADLDFCELESFVDKMLVGEYRIDQRAILQATIVTPNGENDIFAFNDIVLTRPSIAKMIHLETFVDGRSFNTYYGDGVVVSTPTGSTAYNLSAGGPVLFPLTQVFALTPICPHSLTQRPVVFPGHFEIEMKTPDASALVIIDGQDLVEISDSDTVHIKLASNTARLIHRKEFNYFEVLKEKLGWGN